MQRTLLYSGGLDSFIAWHYLDYPQTIYVNLDHKYSERELLAISETVPTTFIANELDLSEWEQPDAFIPMRNMFLVGIAAHYTQAPMSEIILVVQKGEMEIPDRCNEFMNVFGALLSTLNQRVIRVSSPFTEMTKTEMVSWYLERGLPVQLLHRTSSCYSGQAKPCMACNACFRRWVAFYLNGLTSFEDNARILQWDGTFEYMEKMKANKYDPQRAAETIKAVEEGAKEMGTQYIGRALAGLLKMV